MPVEVFLCEKFRHRHERKAFGRFLQEMLDRFRDSNDSYVIIGEPEVNTASMDMIVLTHHAMIVLEMKEITAIIRPKKVTRTKEVLDSLGFPAMNASRVMGRGKQRAILDEVNFEIDDPALLEMEGAMNYKIVGSMKVRLNP